MISTPSKVNREAEQAQQDKLLHLPLTQQCRRRLAQGQDGTYDESGSHITCKLSSRLVSMPRGMLASCAPPAASLEAATGCCGLTTCNGQASSLLS